MAEIDVRPEDEMSPERKQRLGRIQFRCWRRGFREADMVLGPFSDQVAPTLTEAELRWLMDKEYAYRTEDVVWRRSKLGLLLGDAQIAAIDTWMQSAR